MLSLSSRSLRSLFVCEEAELQLTARLTLSALGNERTSTLIKAQPMIGEAR